MSKKPLFLPIVTVLVGLFFSAWVAFSLYQSEKNKVAVELQKDIDNAALAFSRELNVTIELLYVMQSQLGGYFSLDKPMFDRLSARLMTRLQHIDSIKWLQAVNASSRDSYEKMMSASYPNYQITRIDENNEVVRADSKTHYFPVRFTSKPTIHSDVVGLDIASFQSIANSLNMSWLRGLPVAVPSSALQRDLHEKNSFFVLFPVFEGAPTRQSERIIQIEGFLLVLLDVTAMFEASLGNTVRESLKLTLQRLNEDNSVEKVHEDVQGVTGNLLKEMHYSASVFFVGREWQITGTPSQKYLAKRTTFYPYAFFLIGSSIFALLGYLIYVLQYRAMRIHARIDEKTRELREANRMLERMSRRDSLTGLSNRTYFDESMLAELKRAQRDEIPISVLLVEVDNLADYNQRFGRSAGDNCLRLIGAALNDALKRPGDLIARYDAEMFAVLLPNTQNGAPIADICLEAVRKLKIPCVPMSEESKQEAAKDSSKDSKKVTKKSSSNTRRASNKKIAKENEIVTVSIGGVTVVEAEKIDEPQLRTQIHLALTKAVAQGRNRVQWIFSPETSQPNYPANVE